jgi:hypothetical protein
LELVAAFSTIFLCTEEWCCLVLISTVSRDVKITFFQNESIRFGHFACKKAKGFIETKPHSGQCEQFLRRTNVKTCHQCFGSGSTRLSIQLVAWIRICILNADPDSGLKRAKMKKKNAAKRQKIRHNKYKNLCN